MLTHKEDYTIRTPENQEFAKGVRAYLNIIGDMLIEKNIAYGNSASNPVRIFSKTDKLEQIRVRIDDKLSRIARGHEYPGDDTINDLIGYLVLYQIEAKKRKAK